MIGFMIEVEIHPVDRRFCAYGFSEDFAERANASAYDVCIEADPLKAERRMTIRCGKAKAAEMPVCDLAKSVYVVRIKR